MAFRESPFLVAVGDRAPERGTPVYNDTPPRGLLDKNGSYSEGQRASQVDRLDLNFLTVGETVTIISEVPGEVAGTFVTVSTEYTQVNDLLLLPSAQTSATNDISQPPDIFGSSDDAPKDTGATEPWFTASVAIGGLALEPDSQNLNPANNARAGTSDEEVVSAVAGLGSFAESQDVQAPDSTSVEGQNADTVIVFQDDTTAVAGDDQIF